MKAKELRIDNLITWNSTQKKVIPNMLNQPEIIFENNAKPIPLTKEWLVKLGWSCFTKLADTGVFYSYYRIEDDGFNTLTYRIIVGAKDGMMVFPNMDKRIELKSVHQLQNLYHALTEKELTIK